MNQKDDKEVSRDLIIQLLEKFTGLERLDSFDQTLARIRTLPREATLKELHKLLTKGEFSIRCSACEALILLDFEGSRTAILDMLDDPDRKIKYNASYWLIEYPQPLALDSLIEILQNHPDPDIRRNAAIALGLIGSEEILPILLKVSKEDTDLDLMGVPISEALDWAVDKIKERASTSSRPGH